MRPKTEVQLFWKTTYSPGLVVKSVKPKSDTSTSVSCSIRDYAGLSAASADITLQVLPNSSPSQSAELAWKSSAGVGNFTTEIKTEAE